MTKHFPALVVVLLTIGAGTPAGAQMKTLGRDARPQVSCGPTASLYVRIVDSRGTLVQDARIEVLRQRDKKKVAVGMNDLSLDGEYKIIDDLSLPLVAPRGEPFVVRIRRGKTLTSKVLRIGRTPDDCHVIRLDPQGPIVLRR